MFKELIKHLQDIGLLRLVTPLLIIWGLRLAVRFIRSRSRRNYLWKLAKKARKDRDTAIATEYTDPNTLPENVQKLILNSSACELLALLNEGKVTSVQILQVYHNRAITIGLKSEMIAQSNYKEALALAKACDETRKNASKEDLAKLPPLYGLPISIKDSFDMKGLHSTCGVAKYLEKPVEDEGLITKILRDQGAIPFIRSNVPQTLLGVQSVNNIWGRALNPWDKTRTVGGSSGGEAGMVSSKLSPIGFGSDGVGSLRIPAAFCGVYSFKPTKGRTTTRGHTAAGIYGYGKFTMLCDQMGPIARNVDDCLLIFKAILEKTNKYDVLLPEQPWDDSKFKDSKPLKIAYIPQEDFLGSCKTAKRAVREAAAALQKLGHTVVETKIPDFENIIIMTLRILMAEGRARGLTSFLDGEQPMKEMGNALLPQYLPNWIVGPLSILIGAMGEKRSAKVLKHMKDTKTHEFCQLSYDFFMMKNAFIEWWKQNGFDAVILPATSQPACKHSNEDTFAVAYNFPANVGNFPSGCMPITKVKEGEDKLDFEDYPHNDMFLKIAKKNVEGSVGLPVSVQIWTLPYQDEKCFRIMKEIESVINFHELPKI